MSGNYKETLKKVYDSISLDFDKTRKESWKPVKEFFDSFSEDNSDKLVLDLGCGTGRDTIYALKKGFNVVSVDFSEGQVSVLRKKVKELGFKNKHKYVIEDMTSIEFEDESFDIIIAIASIHHLKKEEQIKIVKKIEKWLKKKGKVLVSVWAFENERFKDLKEQETYVKWGKYKRYYYLFKEGELEDLFKENTKLKIIKAFREGMNYWIILEK